EKRISNTDSAVVAKATMAKSAHSTCREPQGRATAISISFQPFDPAQGRESLDLARDREPVERPVKRPF
ncbi:MAG: hypothetical protein JW883_13085, partial [Deltaproteobacteria bacterium]|nr:hypothetical protein [Deltaproteobacteria bacterium]